MTDQHSEIEGTNRASSDTPSRSRSLWAGIAGAVATLGIVSFAVVTGVAQWLLSVVGILLILDVLSGVHLITPFLFMRIFLPLVLTIVLVPFSLIWPGDPGRSHGSTVRARFRSIEQMWRGYWDLDRGL